MADSRDTLDRRRAQHAYDQLCHMQSRGALEQAERRAQGLPIEVRCQGLAVAVATLVKEDRSPSRDLAGLLAAWLLSEADVTSARVDAPTAEKLLERVTTCSRTDYLVLQTESLAYLEHVKRLATALKMSKEKAK